MLTRIPLNEIQNDLCKTGCTKKDRQEIAENDLCGDVISQVDSLAVRCVGEWAVEKIYLLNQYFGIFATSMKDKWDGKINYIEICSGPGRCINRQTGCEFDGTVLSIIRHNAFQYVKKALFFDFDANVVQILNERIKALDITKAKAMLGDYNSPETLCNVIANEISPYSLNLVFIDPTDCSVPFSLIKEIKKKIPKADLIINVASGTDFTRNIGKALLNPGAHSKCILKYSRFLDSDASFFKNKDNIEFAGQGNSLNLRKNFRELYIQKLKNIGYKYFEYTPVKHYYDLLFVSEHETGIKFWKKATQTKFDGQRSIIF